MSTPTEIASLPFDATAFASHTLSSAATMASVLDHTLLKPEATRAQVIQLCREACLLYTSPSPRDRQKSRMPSSA